MKAIDTITGIEVLYDTNCDAPVHAGGCERSCPTTEMTPEKWEDLKLADRTHQCFGCNNPITVIFSEPVNQFDQHYL